MRKELAIPEEYFSFIDEFTRMVGQLDSIGVATSGRFERDSAYSS